jgi:cellulose synthase operon protein YhjU
MAVSLEDLQNGEGSAAKRLRPTPYDSTPRLAGWNLYFLAKLALYWQGLIGLHALENLALALLLLMPLKRRWVAALRTLLALPVAAALLYYDSYLPPFARLVAQSSQIASFSPAYLAELAGRFVSLPTVVMLLVVVAGYRIAALRLRVGVLVVTALAVLSIAHQVSLNPAAAPAIAQERSTTNTPATREAKLDLDGVLRDRFATESKRRVTFNPPAATAAPFDVIFLHVCSLAWDDLRATGLDNHPLLQNLDFVLTNFNSGASYSGPAVIRMLRAPCGVSSHSDLYAPPADGDCYLLPALKRAGFQPSVVLNHDGHFDGFLGVVRAQGNAGIQPLGLDGLPVAQRSFDDSPIYDDLAVLQRWQASVQSGGATRVATYFNTISLHDGNRLTGANASLASSASYKIRLKKLLDDFDTFIARLAQGNRRAIVVLLPEHGAALRGDKMQVAGMREVPTPAITQVPVGIKVIGPGAHRAGPTLRIDAPTSYLAVSHIIARMLDRSPFAQAEFAPQDYAAELPETPFVAENAGTVMLRQDGRYYLRIGTEGWSEYAASQP